SHVVAQDWDCDGDRLVVFRRLLPASFLFQSFQTYHQWSSLRAHVPTWTIQRR
ncbi:hypothetical protein JMJ77_0010898, partial [Colletotrichum scovillei]